MTGLFPSVVRLALLLSIFPGVVSAEQLFQLRNGMVLRGSKAEIATLKDGFGAAGAGQINVRPIWLIDDGLRRIYLHGKGMVAGDPVDVGELERTIELWQPTPLGGKAVGGLGSILGVSPLNEYGRRQLTIRGPTGPMNVIQGITEINSRYSKLIALESTPTLLWDMRVATSSLDSETLKAIFRQRLDQKDLNQRLEVVRFFIGTERFEDAKQVLLQTIADFPQEADLKAQVVALTQRQASQLLDEAETRTKSGQYELAQGILDNFPTQEVGRIAKLQVEDAIAKIQSARQNSEQLIEQLRQQVAQLAPLRADALRDIVDEIAAGLSPDTIARLSDYSRLGTSDTIQLDNRIALAIAGWLLGSGSGEQNLTVVTSLVRVRDLVAEYLRSDQADRKRILRELSNLEGALPIYVDRMLPLLLPPLEWPEGSENPSITGMHAISVGGVPYIIQLPPEYNPLRQYPCVVTLHETRGNPEDQINWWAGVYNKRSESRLGHASRNGFIVVAPSWSRPGQRRYEYTAREHERVLVALRDAMRRASIDSDRVFLAGHGEGGTAAWDIALAHPDLWAGMISISGSPGKTVPHYVPNSRMVPMYLVMGEKDASRADGSILDDYMSFNHDAMVVMFRGRGREYFYDEIKRLFEWMNTSAHRRPDLPREIEATTMRVGDQFFWWLELGRLKPDVEIDPIRWAEAERIRAGKISASIGTDNQIRIRGPAEQFTLLLRPQPGIDLDKEVIIRYGTRPYRFEYSRSLEPLLEDVRRRADRNRPFWFSVTVP